MNQNENSNKENSDEELLEVARNRFKLAVELEADLRKEALDDLKFSNGDQWPEEIKRARAQDNRPCLVINLLPQNIHQVTNDQRQNRPAIKVSPVDDKADIDTAKILQGMVRHIEYASNADTAYETAFDRTVRSRFGYFRVITDYVNPMSFDQEIRIKTISDQFSVYLDPHFREPDGSDANWGFVFEDISKDDFKSQYPDAEISKTNDWEALSENSEWVKRDTVRVAEYFYKEYRETDIVLLSDGTSLEKSKLPKVPGVLPDGLTVVKERKTQLPVVKWCKINGDQILEKTDWLGKWIPIIPVLGEELFIEGKRVLNSLITHAKDSQRMRNFHKSNEAETIALAPKAPFIVAEGQLEGHEHQWASANIKNHAYLQYKPVDLNGQPVPPPQRNAFEPPIQAITQASLMAGDDIKATTGIYDASLGAQGNEKSGIAIQRRNNQSQTANFHFVDNLSKSIRHAGRIIVDLIPKIYDTERAVRILGEDGSEEVVKINAMFNHNGKDVVYNFAGDYDVTVDTGPSFETKRQEAVASMADMSRANPQLMQVAGDIMVGNMDWPGAKEIAERIKKTLPAGIADDPKDQNQQLPPQVQQQMQQMNQMIDQLTGQLNEARDVLDQKKLELESKERIEMAKLNVQLEIALAQMGSKDSQTLLQHEVAGIKHRLDLLHMNQPIEDESNEAAGPDQAVQPQINQPTGGQSPGQPMGV